MRTSIVFAALLGCHASAARPAVENAPVAGAATAGPGLATRLRGPFASIEAYCAAIQTAVVPGAAAIVCDPLDTYGAASTFAHVAAVRVTSADDPTVRHCAMLVETGAGWFATAPSVDACAEPSYIEPGNVNSFELEGADGVELTLDVTWHTKNYDDEARYVLTTLCGTADGAPVCTPLFTSECEDRAPARECSDHGYALRWTIADHAITFTPSRPLPTAGDDVQALLGAHRLGF
ncbi:MAG: hypothetical protein K8W52_16790 [Deltaproteobacteria bacterium]|nr:hypothetical protein [Deltaproteobacteria bacterium]